MTDNAVKPCPFCQRDPAPLLEEDELSVIYQDGFPISPGHTLIIPKRHVAILSEATEAEQKAVFGWLVISLAGFFSRYVYGNGELLAMLCNMAYVTCTVLIGVRNHASWQQWSGSY